MPVQDPFGPTVWQPLPTNTGPGSASEGWATGITNLGRALFPDPSTLAEARLRGQQSQLLQTQANARSNLAKIFADPNAAADPANRAQVYSWMTQLPADEQNAWHQNLAGVIQNTTGMTQAQRDQYNAGAGMVPAENTPSGFNAKLQNQLDTAHIGANAQTTSAQIGAGATIGAEQIRAGEQRFEWGGSPENVTSPGGPGMPPAGPAVVSRSQATSGGFMPHYQNPSDTAVVVGARGATSPPSHGNAPPPQATQPQPQTSNTNQPTTPPPAGPTGNPASEYAGAVQTQMFKTPPAGMPKADINTEIDQKTGNVWGQAQWWPWGGQVTGKPGDTPYQLSEPLRNAVAQRANQYYLNPANKGTYGNAETSVTAAWNDLITPIQHQLQPTWNYHGGASTIELPANVKLPTPSPLAPNAAVPSTPTPLPPSGRQAIAPPAAPPAPRRAAPAAAPKTVTSMNQIPPDQYKANQLVVHGRMFTGGDPTSINSWRPATQAELATANKGGYNYQ